MVIDMVDPDTEYATNSATLPDMGWRADITRNYLKELNGEPVPARCIRPTAAGHFYNRLVEWPIEEAIRMIGPNLIKSALILHIGVGYPHEAHLFSGLGARLIAADISALSLRCAKMTAQMQGFAYEDYIGAPAESLPFRDNTFDIVLLQKTICYWSNPLLGIREALRVGKRIMIIAEPAESLVRTIAKRIGFARSIGSWSGRTLFEISLGVLKNAIPEKSCVTLKRYLAPSIEASLPPSWVARLDKRPRIGCLLSGCLDRVNRVIGRWGNQALVLIEKNACS
jgi:ubiquinone/menaquinone biosynthesis C-methylase UbiE